MHVPRLLLAQCGEDLVSGARSLKACACACTRSAVCMLRRPQRGQPDRSAYTSAMEYSMDMHAETHYIIRSFMHAVGASLGSWMEELNKRRKAKVNKQLVVCDDE